MDLKRVSGILLHPTSLPGPFGIGDIGPQAYRFVDFLADTGQSLWQILPLGPIGYGNSPYMSFSAFGGNPLLISLERIVDAGLLDPADIENPPSFPHNRVTYSAVNQYKMPLLMKSYQRFKDSLPAGHREDFHLFCQQNAYWLDDYALFMSLRRTQQNQMWVTWDESIIKRSPEKLIELRHELIDDIQFQKYLQYVFFKQWTDLKSYCHKRGIQIIGDISIYVAHDSSEVWAHQHLFYLDQLGNPLIVAGVPPDYFSATGQRWGNPLYRWDVLAQSGYTWWIERFRSSFSMFDIIRIDHFRGFEAYWEIPASEETALKGQWVKGPGAALFEAVQKTLGDIHVIAEDLGVITPEVDALRDHFGFPGMRVLQMAFGNDPKAPEYRPHSHIKNCVVYTGTHDNDTTVGWFTSKPGAQTTQTKEEVFKEREYALKYTGTDGSEIHWDFIRLAMGSVAHMAIFPLQDVLGLGTEARMNLPSTSSDNWEWRFTEDMLTPSIKQRLQELTIIYERSTE